MQKDNNRTIYNNCIFDPEEGESLVQDNTRCSTQEVDTIHSLSEEFNQLLKLSSLQELNQLTDHQKYIDNDDNNIITNMNMNVDNNNTSTNTNMMNIDGNNISTNTNMMDINNDNISTNEPITMTTFTLHPNVIRAMSDQWSDIVHFEPFETNNSNIDIRYFYYGGNQIDYYYDNQY
ncbi:6267_t:CDS:2 [Entrophospora sp. SA101]|nr:6267_t:CDS:2 [Entrophospora sp. SA101]